MRRDARPAPGRTLSATMPRLILEARRVAATVIHGLHGRRRAGSGENFWQFRRFVSGEPAGTRRLAPLGARRPSLCARAGMGSRAHGVDLAGPLALDGVRLAAGLGDQARPRAGDRVRARRGAGRGRRARRHSGPDAPEREPQHHREHGRDHRARSDRAREPAALVRALAAVRDRGAVRPVEPDRGRACAPSRSFRRTARTGTWCRSSIRRRRPSRSPAASSSSIPRTGTRSRSAAPKPGARSTSSALERHRAEIRAETDRLGWSFIIHRTDRPGERAAARAAHPDGRRAGRHRHQPLARGFQPGAPHDRRPPARFRAAAGAARPAQPAGAVVAVAPGAAAPAPRRSSGSEKLLLDILPKEETPARTPWWLTLLRLTLAALLIIAAAGPLWNPPLATSQASAPLALLIDDGWAAAATWDTRVRTAEDLIARAETDNRGVAIIALSEIGRDISLETPGAARVRLRQLKPKPHTIDRTEALPAITRFLAGARRTSKCCGSPTASMSPKARSSSPSSASSLQGKSVTVVEGGVAPAHALTAADNAAGSLTVKVLRARRRRQRHRPGARARPEGPAARRSAVRLQGQRARDRSDVRPAGRNPQRHRAA